MNIFPFRNVAVRKYYGHFDFWSPMPPQAVSKAVPELKKGEGRHSRQNLTNLGKIRQAFFFDANLIGIPTKEGAHGLPKSRHCCRALHHSLKCSLGGGCAVGVREWRRIQMGFESGNSWCCMGILLQVGFLNEVRLATSNCSSRNVNIILKYFPFGKFFKNLKTRFFYNYSFE